MQKDIDRVSAQILSVNEKKQIFAAFGFRTFGLWLDEMAKTSHDSGVSCICAEFSCKIWLE